MSESASMLSFNATLGLMPGGHSHRGSELSQASKKELLQAKLTDFYRQYNPSKLYTVPEICDLYLDNLPDLFASLLQKYPRAPKDSFDDLLVVLRPPGGSPTPDVEFSTFRGGAGGTGGSVTPDTASAFADGGGSSTSIGAPMVAINTLLSDGERLLMTSPSRPKVRNDQSNEAKYRTEVAALNALIEENLQLAAEVSRTEQAVLQARFKVLIARCLNDPELDQDCSAATCTIDDASRTLHFPASRAVLTYLSEGPFRVSLNAQSHKCRVQTSATQGVATVDRNVLAMALRELSKAQRHTVSEFVGGSWVFYSSSTIWWMWPSPPLEEPMPAGQSLFHDASATANAIPDQMLTVGRGEGGGRNLSMDEVTAERATGLDVHHSLQQQPGYWSHFLDQWDVLSSTLRDAELLMRASGVGGGAHDD